MPTPTLPVRNAVVMVWQAAGGFRYRMPWGYLIQIGAGGGMVKAPSSVTATTIATLGAGLTAPASAAREVRTQLRRWCVRTVALDPTPIQAKVVRFLARALGRP
ncbi:MAG: hypothetical protein WB020_06915, partial [Candidatus Dormiibacterota bacterium]